MALQRQKNVDQWGEGQNSQGGNDCVYSEPLATEEAEAFMCPAKKKQSRLCVSGLNG